MNSKSFQDQTLKSKKIAILATNGVEEAELLKPQAELLKAGAEVDVISLEEGQIQGMVFENKGQMIDVQKTLAQVSAEDYAGLVLPGGVANPDNLRVDAAAVQFVRDFIAGDKLIAAICHGSWTLIEAGGVRGKKMTSWPSLKTDLRNAGAQWADQEVIVDGKLVTSRKPDDLPAFIAAFVELLQTEARHETKPDTDQDAKLKTKDSVAPSAQI